MWSKHEAFAVLSVLIWFADQIFLKNILKKGNCKDLLPRKGLELIAGKKTYVARHVRWKIISQFSQIEQIFSEVVSNGSCEITLVFQNV